MTGAKKREAALYCLPLGVDFPRALIDGLDARFGGSGPDALARVSLYVNTTRMQRRLLDLYAQGPARLLPRIRLITELGRPMTSAAPVSALRRRLELTQLVQRLIEADPTLAPTHAAFDLAGGLTALLDEMQDEGVSLDDIAHLDVSDLSGHWARSQKFLGLLDQYLKSDGQEPQDPNIAQRASVEALVQDWKSRPPTSPIVIAGSTGSRGTTRLLMQAVAQLPSGAVVLPGVDRDMPGDVWNTLLSPELQHDHPQFRYAALAQSLGVRPEEIPLWHATEPAEQGRNRLVSLALRPAPVTDGWMRDGPSLGPLPPMTKGLTLIEAADPREEANAIALRLRAAIESGQTTALVSPDRVLTRRVAAALDRWGILPDDSAGEPLRQTPVGRLVRHAAGLFGRRLAAEPLLVLLKHPLVHGAAGRGPHVLATQELELSLRRNGPAFPDAAALHRWVESDGKTHPERRVWVDWVAAHCLGHEEPGPRHLADFTETLTQLVTGLLAGSIESARSVTWPGPDGEKAQSLLSELAAEAEHGGDMTPAAFQALLSDLLSEQVREPVQPRNDVMIWGTLEARVQGADLLVLGGLNDGTWPETPAADPWLNRQMREAAGLLVPERQIGLSAHDFQQAIASREVVLTRALRTTDSETIPSRWLNRLMNLLEGLPAQQGDLALQQMRERGAEWVGFARALDRPSEGSDPAPRPSPCPPVSARPRKLSVTEIETLIRDPYATYARRILGLKPIDALRKEPDARARGTVLHKVLERYVPLFETLPEDHRVSELLAIAEAELEREVPWPATRRLWLARLKRSAQWFVNGEIERQRDATPAAFECSGSLRLPALEFTLNAKADRIDRDGTGRLYLYDYKTGAPPTVNQQKSFNQQLLLEVLIAEKAGFHPVFAGPVERAEYIGLGSTPRTVPAPLDDVSTDKTLESLTTLLTAFFNPDKGYTAQKYKYSVQEQGEFDHLARAGEWDLSTDATIEKVGW